MLKKIDYSTYEKPTDFAKFKQGDNILRIISSGGMVRKHGMRTAAGFVPLGDCTETADCKFCLQGNEAKNKWMWIGFIRPNLEPKILDVGPMLGDAICKLAKEHNKDPMEFDIVVNKVGEKLKTKYKASFGEVVPLTPEELEKVKAGKLRLIKKYFTAGKEDNG